MTCCDVLRVPTFYLRITSHPSPSTLPYAPCSRTVTRRPTGCRFRFGVGVWGLGFGVWGLGFGVWSFILFQTCALSDTLLSVTCHTSHVTRHTSHVARHTSHVTRHTSHVTRHTSHITHYLQTMMCASACDSRIWRVKNGLPPHPLPYLSPILRKGLVTRHTSHVTRHTSHVTCCMRCVHHVMMDGK